MLPLGYSKHKPLVEETGSFQQVQGLFHQTPFFIFMFFFYFLFLFLTPGPSPRPFNVVYRS